MGRKIDKVTIDRVDNILRTFHITESHLYLDLILDVVEVIEDKGGKVNLKDIETLQENHHFFLEKIEEQQSAEYKRTH